MRVGRRGILTLRYRYRVVGLRGGESACEIGNGYACAGESGIWDANAIANVDGSGHGNGNGHGNPEQ